MRPNRTALVITVAAAVLAGSVIVALTVGNSAGTGIAIPSQHGAASSALPQLSGTDPVSGTPVSFASFRGKPLFVNLWASWCPGCNEEAPDIARFTRDHPEVGFVGVDVEDTVGDAKAFVARYGWTHRSLFDPNGSLGARLGLQGLPTTIAVDAAGRVVAQFPGTVTYASLTAAAAQMSGAR